MNGSDPAIAFIEIEIKGLEELGKGRQPRIPCCLDNALRLT
jgi:hypothetical protein